MSTVDKSKLHPLQKKHHPFSMAGFLEPFFKGFDEDFMSHPLFSKDFSPIVDVKESDDHFDVVAELPGVDQNDVKLSLRDNTLYISGEKKEEKVDEKEGYYHKESSSGSFTRAVPLPTEVHLDQVEAKFEKGKLLVTLPKDKEVKEKTREIPIHS
jgi:HSP20 family protein